MIGQRIHPEGPPPPDENPFWYGPALTAFLAGKRINPKTTYSCQPRPSFWWGTGLRTLPAYPLPPTHYRLLATRLPATAYPLPAYRLPATRLPAYPLPPTRYPEERITYLLLFVCLFVFVCLFIYKRL